MTLKYVISPHDIECYSILLDAEPPLWIPSFSLIG
jgi:hypothetical protein